MAFTTLASLQLGVAVAARSDGRPALRLGWRGNPLLGATVAGTLLAQAAVIYVGPIGRFLHTERLSPLELLCVAGASTVTFIALELEKWWRRRHPGPKALQAGREGSHTAGGGGHEMKKEP